MTASRPSPPNNTRTRREGDQLRGELLLAAAALASGPRPVAIPSLRAVARACDVSAAAVYRHFSSQSALTKALLTAQYESFETAVLDGDQSQAHPYDRLQRLARAYVRWGLDNPGMYQLLFESADQLGDDGLGDVSHRTTALAEELLTAWNDQGGTAITSTTAAHQTERFWFALHGSVSLRIHKPGQQWLTEPEAEAERLVDSLRQSP